MDKTEEEKCNELHKPIIDRVELLHKSIKDDISGIVIMIGKQNEVVEKLKYVQVANGDGKKKPMLFDDFCSDVWNATQSNRDARSVVSIWKRHPIASKVVVLIITFIMGVFGWLGKNYASALLTNQTYMSNNQMLIIEKMKDINTEIKRINTDIDNLKQNNK